MVIRGMPIYVHGYNKLTRIMEPFFKVFTNNRTLVKLNHKEPHAEIFNEMTEIQRSSHHHFNVAVFYHRYYEKIKYKV